MPDAKTNATQETALNDSDSGKDYIILPNGKKKYTSATGVDFILCLILPGIGFIIGLYALILRREAKRGGTMLLISLIAVVIFGLLRGMK